MAKSKRCNSLNRRQFIQTAGVISGLSVLHFPIRELLAKDPRDRLWTTGVETWTPSTCNLCPAGCGILVRVVDNNAVKIEGNPHHPVNRGTLCPKGHALLQRVYHDRRLRIPILRDRKTESHRAVSWDAALASIAERLRAFRVNGQNQEVLCVGQVLPGTSRTALENFAQQLGFTAVLGDGGGSGLAHAHFLTQGVRDLVAYDLENTDYLLSFSSALLDSWWSPVTAHHAYAHLRRNRGTRTRIVEIGPRFSRTASRADEWVPVRPGTEGLFALGVAYVLVKEMLYEQEFVDKLCWGFQPVAAPDGRQHDGFRAMVLREFRPEKVSAWTGAPVEQILRIAKEFAGARSAVAVSGRELTSTADGTRAAATVHMLNALKGNFDQPGGVLLRRTIPNLGGGAQEHEFPTPDRVGLGGFSTLHAGALANALDNSVQIMFLLEPEIILKAPGGDALRKALEAVPLVIGFSTVHEESVADIVLPITTCIEEYGDIHSSASCGFPVIGIQTPAIDAGGARSIPDILAQLGHLIAPELKPGWNNAASLLQQRMGNLFAAQQGTIFTDPFETEQVRVLEERGWRVPIFDNSRQFTSKVLEKGGWWDPAYTRGEWARIFRTPSRRFEFVSGNLATSVSRMLNVGATSADRDGLLVQFSLSGPDPYMPIVCPPRSEKTASQKYPLTFIAYEPLAFSFGWGGESEWLLESSGMMAGVRWSTWVDINPATAQRLGIQAHDRVRVETENGFFDGRARISVAAMPDTLFAPLGMGRRILRESGEPRGSRVESSLTPQWDQLSGEAVLGPTPSRLIRLEAAGHGEELS